MFYRDANEPTCGLLRDCENLTDGSFAALVLDNILCICHRCTNTVAVHPSMISFCTQSQPHPVSSQSQYWRAHIWFILPHCPVSTQCHTVHTVHQIAKFSAHLNWRPAAENKGCSSPKHHQGQSPPAAEEMQAEQKSSIESLHLIDTLSKQERQINNGNWQSFKCFKRKKYQCYHLVAYFQDDTLNIYLFNRTIL